MYSSSGRQFSVSTPLFATCTKLDGVIVNSVTPFCRR